MHFAYACAWLARSLGFSRQSTRKTVLPDCSPEFAPAQSGRICLERLEDTGALNIIPLQIAFGNGMAATLTGGAAICVDLVPGSYSLSLDWQTTDGREGEGTRIAAKVEPSGFTPLTICKGEITKPTDDWQSGWVIVPRDQARSACELL
jgi:hypothetical protein